MRANRMRVEDGASQNNTGKKAIKFIPTRWRIIPWLVGRWIITATVAAFLWGGLVIELHLRDFLIAPLIVILLLPFGALIFWIAIMPFFEGERFSGVDKQYLDSYLEWIIWIAEWTVSVFILIVWNFIFIMMFLAPITTINWLTRGQQVHIIGDLSLSIGELLTFISGALFALLAIDYTYRSKYHCNIFWPLWVKGFRSYITGKSNGGAHAA